ncbi:MAG: hypothetical protein DHS20C15_19850 [Planctomycetota bacterium]|nr:MAG: hypothetical protein DHS20C15_19850 [Planctomycetota bacterium]
MLECVIATLLMTLMAYGWMRLHSSHAELVASLDEDLFTHKAYYVDRPDSEAARVLGVAARLSRNPAVLPQAVDPEAPFALTIVSAERALRPPSASARVHMVEN